MKASFPDESAAKITKRLKSMWCEAGHEERLRWKSIEVSNQLRTYMYSIINYFFFEGVCGK